MVYNGHLKFQTSVSLRIPLYGSRNLAYIARKMDYMCPLQRVRYKPYWVYAGLLNSLLPDLAAYTLS